MFLSSTTFCDSVKYGKAGPGQFWDVDIEKSCLIFLSVSSSAVFGVPVHSGGAQ